MVSSTPVTAVTAFEDNIYYAAPYERSGVYEIYHH
jgi:hypothetical protein